MTDKIIISGVGCCLVDIMYNNVDFTSDAISHYISKKRGDGGLTPGKLVFQEEFEQYSGISLDNFIKKFAGVRNCDKINIGGPSIVSLIHAAQLTSRENCEVRFYGRAGNDNNGMYLVSSLGKTPVVLKDFKLLQNRTPSTLVLSDPTHDNGHGERMFINSIGAAWDYYPEELDDDFFNSNIVVFGGTALVPNIHDHLTTLLKKAKSKGCITIVNTVFDFRNEKDDPSKRWPLGEDDESYRLTDILITDKEEALRLSGESDINKAVKFFLGNKVPSFIITAGSSDIITCSNGSFFNESPANSLPVSHAVRNELKSHRGGDTTGCGDNFAGGVIASVVNQLITRTGKPDLNEACSWGIVSGGFACFYMGGTYFEENPGEKIARIKPYYDSYREQISKG
jgi:sugar/nucleoside kinase (ribokinase family)